MNPNTGKRTDGIDNEKILEGQLVEQSKIDDSYLNDRQASKMRLRLLLVVLKCLVQ